MKETIKTIAKGKSARAEQAREIIRLNEKADEIVEDATSLEEAEKELEVL